MHVLTRTGDLLIFHSFPLISRYLSGDVSDSDSGEDCADDDNDEPEDNTKSESRENEKFDESDDYRKKADSLQARSTERFRILKETNPEILPVYPVYLNPKTKTSAKTGGAAQGCSRIYMSRTWMRKDLFIVTPENINVQPINFMLFLRNLIFLRKLPLIKLQIY